MNRNIASLSILFISSIDPFDTCAPITGVHPIIFKHPKQVRSQSVELEIIDGPILIIFDDGVASSSCPGDLVVTFEDNTKKLPTFEEDIDEGGAKADDWTIGRTVDLLLPFDLRSFDSPPSSFPNSVPQIIFSSANSSKGRTGNK